MLPWTGGLGCFGEVSSLCLSAKDCSLIIDHQTVFNCQTSKTSARQHLSECLPSFILKEQTLQQQEETAPSLPHKTFQDKSFKNTLK